MRELIQKLLPITFLLVNINITASQATEILNGGGGLTPQQRADQALPLRDEPYTFNEIWDVLEPHLKSEEIRKFYSDSLQLMFTKFGQPTQQNSIIIGGWRCLTRKVVEAEVESDSFTSEFLTRKALLDLLAMHKKSLQKTDAKLYEEVKEHAPCAKCIGEIRKEFMTQSNL